MTIKSAKLIIGSIIIVFFLIVSLPILILSSQLSYYHEIDKDLYYNYDYSIPTQMNDLIISSDLGNIEINYLKEPSEYDINIYIKILMDGFNLVGKSYMDYFKIDSFTTNSLINLSLKLKDNVKSNQIINLIKNISIIINLNPNVLCNLKVYSNIQGNVKIVVPYKRSIGSISVNSTYGNIKLDFSYSFGYGNVSAIIKEKGDIELNYFNTQYIHNSTWILYNELGNILLDISQHDDINANISGIINPKQGIVRFKYRNDNSNIGAYFKLHYNVNDASLSHALDDIIGFDLIPLSGQDIFYLITDDYPKKDNINLLFINTNGFYRILDLQSV